MNTSNKKTANTQIQIKGKDGKYYVLSSDSMPKEFKELLFELKDGKGRVKARSHVKDFATRKVENLDIGNVVNEQGYVDPEIITLQPFNVPHKAQPTAAIAVTPELIVTSKRLGWVPNEYLLHIVDPGVNNSDLKVDYDEQLDHVIISLATDGAGAITTTGAEAKAAVEAHSYLDAHFEVSYPDGEDGTSTLTASSDIEFSGGFSVQFYLSFDGMTSDEEAGNFIRISATAHEHTHPVVID